MRRYYPRRDGSRDDARNDRYEISGRITSWDRPHQSSSRPRRPQVRQAPQTHHPRCESPSRYRDHGSRSLRQRRRSPSRAVVTRPSSPEPPQRSAAAPPAPQERWAAASDRVVASTRGTDLENAPQPPPIERVSTEKTIVPDKELTAAPTHPEAMDSKQEQPRSRRKFTKLCHFRFNNGCKHGNNCPYAHSEEELRDFKPGMCRNFRKHGSCKWGDECGFFHGPSDQRWRGDNNF